MQAQLDTAGALYRVALLDDHRRVRRDPAILCQIAGERSRSGSCGWIFGDSHGGIEEACVSHGRRINRVKAKEVATLTANAAQFSSEASRLRLRTIDRI